MGLFFQNGKAINVADPAARGKGHSTKRELAPHLLFTSFHAVFCWKD
jgi:hypothetical protein